MNARTSAPFSCTVLPDHPREDTVYKLTPAIDDDQYYQERTDRNIGWISEKEQQELVRHSTVGIAGCGGMGGLVASILLRLGVGEIRIADCEVFDASNINRQFGARRGSIGLSKAFETARMLREITDDTTLVVYPMGIESEGVASFVSGCDVICDEIEFWAIASRIMLHHAAMDAKVPILNCNTVGFGTRLFLFTPESMSMETLLDIGYAEACALQRTIQAKVAPTEDIDHAMAAVLKGLVPELPEYSADPHVFSTTQNALRRLEEEQRAMIIATNPPMAAGFMANHVLFQLLAYSALPYRLEAPPLAPGYLYFDALFHDARRIVTRNGFRHA